MTPENMGFLKMKVSPSDPVAQPSFSKGWLKDRTYHAEPRKSKHALKIKF